MCISGKYGNMQVLPAEIYFILTNSLCAFPQTTYGIFTCIFESITGTWNCPCPDAFTGPLCEYNHPCVTQPCYVTGSSNCEEVSNTTRVCECRAGFTGDACDVGPCSAQPCNSAGLRACVEFSNATFVCNCTATYEGSTCQTQKGSKLRSDQ